MIVAITRILSISSKLCIQRWTDAKFIVCNVRQSLYFPVLVIVNVGFSVNNSFFFLSLSLFFFFSSFFKKAFVIIIYFDITLGVG